MPCLITRADDFGANHGTNAAIAAAIRGGFIKNVSCMAGGPAIREGAELLRDSRGCCIGMHAVLNSEWDRLKWRPCAQPHEIPTLLTEEGEFPSETRWFLAHPPEMDEILRELDRQLDCLTRLGLPISYVDMHMMPYAEIPGLRREMSAWIARKGLIDHIAYYRTPEQTEPPQTTDYARGLQNWTAWLDMLESGQYFVVMHPCRYSEESLLMGNGRVPPEFVAGCRDTEYRLLISGALEAMCAQRSITTIRYADAT